MSHFVTLVLVPKDSRDVEGTVSSLLAPYDEDITVLSYQTDCFCIGAIAHSAGVQAATRAVASLDDLRFRYRQLPDDERPTWEAWTADWAAVADRTEQAHPLYQKPDPDCAECHGSGQRPTTYNPDSRWDWWTIGGRWDGWLDPTNQCPAFAVLFTNKTPFAVVTPDGQWHQRGHMGWWGIVSDAQDDETWTNTVRTLLTDHADAIAVTCDLHI